LDEAGVVGPHAFAARLEAALTLLPESAARTHATAVVQTLKAFDPNAGKPVFEVIQGGLTDMPPTEQD
jgi:hypothetical protein